MTACFGFALVVVAGHARAQPGPEPPVAAPPVTGGEPAPPAQGPAAEAPPGKAPPPATAAPVAGTPAPVAVTPPETGAAPVVDAGPGPLPIDAGNAAPGLSRPDAGPRRAALDVGPNSPEGKPAEPEKLRWRDTWLIWDNAVTTQTLGVGRDYLSANPTYEMSGSIRPRYYLHDGTYDWVYLAGRLDIVREMTDSDVTTRRGETLLSDLTLLTAYRRNIAGDGDHYQTTFIASAPVLTLPTSKFSRDNGTLLGLGGGLRLNQTLPLAGNAWSVFQTVTLGVAAGYNHTFTRAVVPTNPELRRVRMDPEGRTVPGDQLTGVAFPEHEVRLDARAIVDVTKKVSLFVEGSYRPTWKYGFDPVDICITTGCVPAVRPADPSTYTVVTAFEADVYYDVIEQLTLALGYSNVAVQPGPDGQRRSIFYSPGAQFFFSVIGHLDAIYLAAQGKQSQASNGGRLRP